MIRGEELVEKVELDVGFFVCEDLEVEVFGVDFEGGVGWDGGEEGEGELEEGVVCF